MILENRQFQIMRVLTWSLPLYAVWFGLSWGLLGHNIPPYNAAYPTEDLARHFFDNRNSLRIGFALAAASTALWMTWSVAIFGIMRRMEGRDGMLSYVQLLGGALTAIVPMMACLFWLTAAFRPETDSAIIQMLFDLGWLTIDLGFCVTTIQMVAIGVLFLHDKREKPLFPKWLNWLGIWVGLEFFAEIIMPYFRSGPFSWNGLFNFYIPFGAPFAWALLLTFFMFKAINRLEQEASDVVPASS